MQNLKELAHRTNQLVNVKSFLKNFFALLKRHSKASLPMVDLRKAVTVLILGQFKGFVFPPHTIDNS